MVQEVVTMAIISIAVMMDIFAKKHIKCAQKE